MEISRPAMEARWGFFSDLQGMLLHRSWPALVARRSGGVACCFWIEAEDPVFFVDAACGWRLLVCISFFLAMVARRGEAAMHWRTLLVDFCLQGAMEMLFQHSIKRHTRRLPATP
jgi:hypothetical protein